VELNERGESIELPNLRVGLGHDTHRLGNGGPLILGGVRIESDRHLIGHSDADVLLHAITDSLLGAVGQGDIGDWFPDTDQANKNLDSAQMLRDVCRRVRGGGFEIVNLDCTIFAEVPKLGPLKQTIRQSIAQVLGLSATQVSVKAKTGEGLDAVGHELAISAQCVVLLVHRGGGAPQP
jgi:2-C-methyl-D-erythritol 2,4-cyclodiphosphate synthase